MDETLNHAPCGFLSLDNQGRILEINATLLERVGYEHPELCGAKLANILTVASRIFYQTHLFPLLALHGRADEVFITLRAKNGRDLPMLIYARQRPPHMDWVLVPVEQRQKYEEEILAAKRVAEEALRGNRDLLDAQAQLQANARELDRRSAQAEQKARELLQVTRILFHDLREPIRKIETFLKMLSTQAHMDLESQALLDRISASSARAAHLLRALQEFVSVEVPDDTLETVKMNEIVVEAHEKVRGFYPDVPVRFDFQPLPEVEGYSRQLRILFEQLFDNAYRFRKSSGELQIAVSGIVVQENSFRATKSRYRYMDYIQLAVSDNGIGIPRHFWSSVFQLLWKADPENSQPGCGLAICQKIVANHLGSITVVQPDGAGTKICILLPLKQEQVALGAV